MVCWNNNGHDQSLLILDIVCIYLLTAYYNTDNDLAIARAMITILNVYKARIYSITTLIEFDTESYVPSKSN